MLAGSLSVWAPLITAWLSMVPPKTAMGTVVATHYTALFTSLYSTAEARLGLAIRGNNAAAARKAVVEDGADANKAVFDRWTVMGGTCTAAYVAAMWGHTAALGAVLDAPGVDPNKGNTRNGWTPCHTACIGKNPDAVTLLLARGADPNRADKNGITPCILAALVGATACLRALAEGAAQQGRALDVDAVATVGSWAGMAALDLSLIHI